VAMAPVVREPILLNVQAAAAAIQLSNAVLPIAPLVLD